MNIHSSDMVLFKQLSDSTIVSVEFGSFRYGLNNASSDTDIFHIYMKSSNMAASSLKRLSNVQFKIDNTDHVFCSFDDFIQDLIDGASTVSFEVLHCLENTELQWLYLTKEMFYSYENARSYLGVARRDCKYYKQNDKKLAHAFRSLKYAQGIINGYFNFVLSKEDQEKLCELRFGVYNRDKVRLDIEKEIEANRVELNKRLEANKIQKKITVDDMRILDNLILYHYTALRKYRTNNHIDMGIFYDAAVNGVNY